MFSIDYSFGPLGVLLLVGLGFVGFVAVTMLLSVARQAHDDVVEEEHDRGNNDFPVA